MQIAQAAFAFFHIGLNHIALALFEVAAVTFVQLCFDKVTPDARKELFFSACPVLWQALRHPR